MFQKYSLLIVILMAQMVFAQQRVAILNSEDDGEPPLKFNELNFLTDKLRDIAVEILPTGYYDIMTMQSVQSFLGSQQEMENVCKNAEGCLAKIGRDIEADYIGQARLSRFGKLFTIKMEVYDVKKGTLIGTFTDGSSNDIYALLAVIEKKAPDMFKKMIASSSKPAQPVAPQQTSVSSSSATTGNFKSVKIGSQTWMAENLNIDVPGSKCYDNKPANCAKYGRLYNWNTAMTVCPTGWHLPTKEEWETLANYVEKDKRCSKCDAKYLKTKNGWWNNYGKGTDGYGFAALPGGNGSSYGGFSNVGYNGYWWSASENNAKNANSRLMYNYIENARWYGYDKSSLSSVRCVQN